MLGQECCYCKELFSFHFFIVFKVPPIYNMMKRTVKISILGIMLTLLLIDSAVGHGNCNYKGLYCVSVC